MSKRKYYIYDHNRKEFVRDFVGYARSSTRKAEVERFLTKRQKYEATLSTKEQERRKEEGLSWACCYIMLLTEQEMLDFDERIRRNL